MHVRSFIPGVVFAALWASASVATKFGIAVANPMVLACTRFLIAGVLMLSFAYLFIPAKSRLPRGKEWQQLFIFSLLNTSLYLGAFVTAIKHVSAGIGSLSTATSPLFIMLFSAVWLKRHMKWFEVAGLVLGLTGVLMACYPLLQTSYATVSGLLILLFGILSVSAATVYYASIKWQLSNLVINGWQVLIGGLTLLPVALLSADRADSNFNYQFWASVLWLIIPVSVIALQLWFYLVKIDTVRASLWLFLCPPFGFVFANTILGEPVSWHTFVGTGLVLCGLHLAQRQKFKAIQR